MQTLPALLLLLSFATAANAADPSAPQGSDAAPRVTLAFHSAFLMNLHHFLYDMAVHKEKLTGLAWHAKPDQKEMAALQNAIAFYRARYADKSLLHDPAMSAIKRALTLDDAIRSASGRGLPAELTATLNRAAPVYARCLWPAHDRSNRDWIAAVRKLDGAYGAAIQAGIERHLGARFPVSAIRDDVVFDTGTRQGAYTDDQIVMPSSRSEYQDLASLEMLYHEASHTTVTAALEAALDARLKAAGRDRDADLWHVAQFYTVGAVTREVLAQSARLPYVPYADKRGLYAGHWAPFMPAIEAGWVPHMQGKLDLAAAADVMVSSLPPARAEETLSAVKDVASSWLVSMDGGDYGKSWDEASTFLKHDFSREYAQSTFQSLRGPLGQLVTRTFLSGELIKVPDGDCFHLQFNSRFTNEEAVIETVELLREKTGEWKVSLWAQRPAKRN